MARANCGWRGCEQPSRLVVLVGAVFEAAEPWGAYCVRHAAVKRQVAEQQSPLPVWLGWTDPVPARRRLVGDGSRGQPLHRHLPERLGSRS